MIYNIGYFTFSGSSGQSRVDSDELTTWLADRPGTLIHSIESDGSLELSQIERDAKNNGLRGFALGILKSL